MARRGSGHGGAGDRGVHPGRDRRRPARTEGRGPARAGDRGGTGWRGKGDDRRVGAGVDGQRDIAGPAVIPVPSNVRVWIATGHTDMRRGMIGLALQVQEGLKRDPHAGDLYVFRGKRGDLVKILWHDGIGLSLYAKRLDRGRFIWPAAVDGAVAITAAQMGYLLEAIDWRNPQHTWRPQSAG